jgi:transposase
MRYPQGGGLTAERRRFRERIRYEAGERFAHGERTAVIAKDLRVSERSVERWRRAWREGGMEALASAGPPKLPKLSEEQFAELEKELARGPALHGWEGQRWTLARIRVSSWTMLRRTTKDAQTGLAQPLLCRRFLLTGGIAMASGVRCALVLLNAVSPEQASAVAVIAASGTASLNLGI